GEQQMLAIARGLMANPKMLLLDEPSLGLAPVLVDQVADTIKEINRTMKMPILLVEQNAVMALSMADYAYVIEVGEITKEGSGQALLNDEEVKTAFLGI
ncbi:MAG: ABC transporter ATP-binding protein, partial [Dehalococcoidales bacterium]|nr:ABC transporter ATP-binding protein [Dehalococcoidales bacterium]